MAAWGSPLPTVTYNISDFASLNNAVARAHNGSRASPRIACGHQDRIETMGYTFSPHTTCATGTSPRSVTTADENGDGQVDLVVATYRATPSEPRGGQI